VILKQSFALHAINIFYLAADSHPLPTGLELILGPKQEPRMLMDLKKDKATK